MRAASVIAFVLASAVAAQETVTVTETVTEAACLPSTSVSTFFPEPNSTVTSFFPTGTGNLPSGPSQTAPLPIPTAGASSHAVGAMAVLGAVAAYLL